MNREEILEKSRRENSVSDERAQYIGMQGATISTAVLVVLWIVLSRVVPMDAAAKNAMGLLVMVTSFSNYAYQFAKARTKTALFFLAAFFIASVDYLILLMRQ